MSVLPHDDVIKWRHFPRYWPFVRGIHRSPVNSPHKGQCRGALMYSFICAWMNDWVNNREAGDFRRYRAHYDVTVMRYLGDWELPSSKLQLHIWSSGSTKTRMKPYTLSKALRGSNVSEFQKQTNGSRTSGNRTQQIYCVNRTVYRSSISKENLSSRFDSSPGARYTLKNTRMHFETFCGIFSTHLHFDTLPVLVLNF